MTHKEGTAQHLVSCYLLLLPSYHPLSRVLAVSLPTPPLFLIMNIHNQTCKNNHVHKLLLLFPLNTVIEILWILDITLRLSMTVEYSRETLIIYGLSLFVEVMKDVLEPQTQISLTLNYLKQGIK